MRRSCHSWLDIEYLINDYITQTGKSPDQIVVGRQVWKDLASELDPWHQVGFTILSYTHYNGAIPIKWSIDVPAYSASTEDFKANGIQRALDIIKGVNQ